MTKNEKLIQEIKLRRLIKKAIKIRKRKEEQKVKKSLQEEAKLKTVIRHLIKEGGGVDADTNPAPYQKTSMNVLAAALDTILTTLKTGLRGLSRPEERVSFRTHVLEKFENMFGTFESLEVSNNAVGESDVGLYEQDEDDDKIRLKIDPDLVVPKSEEGRFAPRDKTEEEKSKENYDKFAIPNEDPTGAIHAFEVFSNSNIEETIANKRKTLPREEDKEEFRDYTLYNIDLWLITYEEELARELGQEPAFAELIMPKPAGAIEVGKGAEIAQGTEEFVSEEIFME